MAPSVSRNIQHFRSIAAIARSWSRQYRIVRGHAGWAGATRREVHPFLDGNGRLGRLLITFFLRAAGAIREPILYLSLYFKTNRSRYYELLDRVRTQGDWETWLEFFLTGVKETAQQAADTSREILALIEGDRRKIEALGRPAASVLGVHQHLQRKPIITIPATAEQLSLSAPTVAKALQHMVKLGLVRERTGKQRHRLFTYHR